MSVEIKIVIENILKFNTIIQALIFGKEFKRKCRHFS